MSELDQFKQLLTAHSASVTQPRLRVFETLQSAQEPMKTGEIARRTEGVNRASVYRTLELFASLGITTTIMRGWIPYTELAEPFKIHHHHAACRTCARQFEIESDILEEAVRTVAERNGFILEQHTIELAGICADCRTPNPAQ